MIHRKIALILTVFIFVFFCFDSGIAISIDSSNKDSKDAKSQVRPQVAVESSFKTVEIKFDLPIISLSVGPHLRLGEDDLDKFRLGEKGYLMNLPSLYYTTDFDWDEKKWGCEPEVRAVIHPIRFRFGRTQLWTGFSLGMGWNKYRTEGNYLVTYTHQNFWDETHEWKYSHDYQLNNTRIFLDTNVLLRKPFFCKCPGKPKFYGYLGLEYNRGKLIHSFKGDYDASFVNGAYYHYNERKTREEEVKDTSLGIRYGLGTDFKISRFLHLGLELYGRNVKFDDWTGERTDGLTWDDNGLTGSSSGIEKGKLWFFRGIDPVHGLYPQLEVREDEPDFPYSDVRPAEIKLNRLGIRLNLNLRLQGLKLKF